MAFPQIEQIRFQHGFARVDDSLPVLRHPIVARIAMMAMTTRSSMMVNPEEED